MFSRDCSFSSSLACILYVAVVGRSAGKWYTNMVQPPSGLPGGTIVVSLPNRARCRTIETIVGKSPYGTPISRHLVSTAARLISTE